MSIPCRDGGREGYQCAIRGIPLRHGKQSDPISRKRKREEDSKRKRVEDSQKIKQTRVPYKNDGAPPQSTEELIEKPKRKRAMGRPQGSTGNAPTLAVKQLEHFAIPFGISNFEMPDSSSIINATNTCCLDSCLCGLAIQRWYDEESSLFMDIKKNKVLDEVLDRVQTGDYDAARCGWINYTLSQISDSSIIKEKRISDCGLVQHWNCESSTFDNLAMMKELFQFTVGVNLVVVVMENWLVNICKLMKLWRTSLVIASSFQFLVNSCRTLPCISIIFIILLARISNVAKVQACMIVTESSNAMALVNIKKN